MFVWLNLSLVVDHDYQNNHWTNQKREHERDPKKLSSFDVGLCS